MRKLTVALVILVIGVILALALIVKLTAKALGEIKPRETTEQQRSDDLSRWKK